VRAENEHVERRILLMHIIPTLLILLILVVNAAGIPRHSSQDD
jgi:hypothetical protein